MKTTISASTAIERHHNWSFHAASSEIITAPVVYTTPTASYGDRIAL